MSALRELPYPSLETILVQSQALYQWRTYWFEVMLFAFRWRPLRFILLIF